MNINGHDVKEVFEVELKKLDSNILWVLEILSHKAKHIEYRSLFMVDKGMIYATDGAELRRAPTNLPDGVYIFEIDKKTKIFRYGRCDCMYPNIEVVLPKGKGDSIAMRNCTKKALNQHIGLGIAVGQLAYNMAVAWDAAVDVVRLQSLIVELDCVTFYAETKSIEFRNNFYHRSAIIKPLKIK